MKRLTAVPDSFRPRFTLPTAVTSSYQASRRSLSFEWTVESCFLFLFSESGREECSSGRNDAPGLQDLGTKLRLHQILWSQNLIFQSQNATMCPDFSSPGTLPLTSLTPISDHSRIWSQPGKAVPGSHLPTGHIGQLNRARSKASAGLMYSKFRTPSPSEHSRVVPKHQLRRYPPPPPKKENFNKIKK